MKTITKFLLIIIILFICWGKGNSQIVDQDSVKVGKSYYIILKNSEQFFAEIISIDSNFIKVRIYDGGLSKILRKNIESIFIRLPEEFKEKMKPEFSASGGLSFNMSESKISFPRYYMLNVQSNLYFSRYVGLRLNFNGSFLGKYQSSYYFYPDPATRVEDVEVAKKSEYNINLDLIIGNFKPKDRTKYYFIGGCGLLLNSLSNIYSTETQYSSDTISYSYGYFNSGRTEFYPLLDLGFGIDHRLSERFSIGGECIGKYIEDFRIWGGPPSTNIWIEAKPLLSYNLSNKLSVFSEIQLTLPIHSDIELITTQKNLSIKGGFKISL